MGRITGLEPATFGTTNQRSNQLSYIRHTESFKIRGGADRTRTDDPLHAMQVLYQLSYNPFAETYSIFLLAKCQINLLIFFHIKENYYGLSIFESRSRTENSANY